jgi:hypothetical protein
VDLPVEHWTQRLLQAGSGGLCGMINASMLDGKVVQK